MALSNQVTDNFKDAESSLRAALSYAARNEKSYVSVIISEMISKIDGLIHLDKISDQLEEKFKGMIP